MTVAANAARSTVAAPVSSAGVPAVFPAGGWMGWETGFSGCCTGLASDASLGSAGLVPVWDFWAGSAVPEPSSGSSPLPPPGLHPSPGSVISESSAIIFAYSVNSEFIFSVCCATSFSAEFFEFFALCISPLSPTTAFIVTVDNIISIIIVITNTTNVIPCSLLPFFVFRFFLFVHF